MIFKNSKIFDFIKWFAVIALPAIGWAYAQLGPAWNLPYVEQIQLTCDVIGTLIGIFLGVSTYRFKHQDVNEGEETE